MLRWWVRPICFIFVGYFPADNPKYSCIVVVHKPSTVNNNYYGADVAGPVLKELHKRFYRCSFDKRNKNIDRKVPKQEKIITTTLLNYKNHSSQMLKDARNGCDCFMENLGVKVKSSWHGEG
jgi:cell division protein FtsI (penicillin-binding protein 3)